MIKKSIFLICIALLSVVGLHAQVTNQTILGGSMSYQTSSYKYDGDKSVLNSFSFGPSVGYMLSDAFAVGLNVNLNFYKLEYAEVFEYYNEESKELELGPYLRYHHQIVDKFSLFGQWNVYKQFELSLDEEDRPDVFGSNLELGLLYFIRPSVSLEVGLGSIAYERTKQGEGDNETIQNDFAISADLLSPTIGIKFYW